MKPRKPSIWIVGSLQDLNRMPPQQEEEVS
jgi:hypothetical protein